MRVVFGLLLNLGSYTCYASIITLSCILSWGRWGGGSPCSLQGLNSDLWGLHRECLLFLRQGLTELAVLALSSPYCPG